MAQNNGKTSTVRNCTFTGNEAQFGFVAALEQNAIANTRVLGCTFTRNRGKQRHVLSCCEGTCRHAHGAPGKRVPSMCFPEVVQQAACNLLGSAECKRRRG